ncbi:MAG: orotidine-5'-phosphate decarboxylase [Acidobacteriota bacterium]
MSNAKDKLIVALDVDSASQALDLFDALLDVVGMFKIGSQLFTTAGPDVVRQIVAKGGRVFLDLKFHDIPNTVAAAGVAATRMGVSIFNVHASGGEEMMKRTAAIVDEVCLREELAKPKVIAVTLLTSMDENTLAQIGIPNQPRSVVSDWARLAADCGLDGVVASPQEIEVVREAVGKRDFLIVTPGIRSSANSTDDQRRVLSAAEAIRAGADYLVVGRPILNADNPAEAAARIVGEIATALDKQE